MSHFVKNLSALLRTGDTRALELVIGLVALVFSGQLAATLLDFLPHSPLVRELSYPVAWLMVGLFLVGGLAKTIGAVLDAPLIRIIGSFLLSGVWIYLAYMSWRLGAVFSLLLFSIFALQSAWIYIRLSLIRKRANGS